MGGKNEKETGIYRDFFEPFFGTKFHQNESILRTGEEYGLKEKPHSSSI